MSWHDKTFEWVKSRFQRKEKKGVVGSGVAMQKQAEAEKRSLTTSQMLAREYIQIWGPRPRAMRIRHLGKALPEMREIIGWEELDKDQKQVEIRKKRTEIRKSIEDRDSLFMEAYQREVLARNQSALCLSGGGIRSAAFALGVIQALAQMGLLSKFHYLSTVSGGGYIGGWLSRLIKEEADKISEGQSGAAPDSPSLSDIALLIERKLASDSPSDREPVTRLREVSNFLTPKVGPTSTDSWSTAVLSVRNILLNWTVFVPLIMLVALAPNWFARLADHMGGRTDYLSIFFLYALLLWGLGVLLVGVYFACSFLPSHKLGDGWPPRRSFMESKDFIQTKGTAHINVIVFGCMWACVLTFVAAILSENAGEQTAERLMKLGSDFVVLGYQPILSISAFLIEFAPEYPQNRLLAGVLIGIATWFMSMTAFSLAAVDSWHDDLKAFLPTNILFWGLASLLGSGLVIWGFFILWGLEDRWQIDVAISLGPLWIIFCYVFQAAVYVGLREKRPNDDDDREWIARVSAVCLRVMAAWAVISSACLLLPRFLWDAQDAEIQVTTALTGIGASLLAAFGGSSGMLSIGKAMTRGGKALKGGIAIATAIAIVSLLALFSRILVNFASYLHDLAAEHGPDFWGVITYGWHDWLVLPLSLFATLLAIMILFASFKIDVNHFSLHGVYRNRLARSFLGSAHETREPHPFTGFDAGDNCRMWELPQKKPVPPKTSNQQPVEAVEVPGTAAISYRIVRQPRRLLFPVINAALNMTSSERLAWQERKAMSFIITPICCGSADLQPETEDCTLTPKERSDPCLRRLGAYVKSRYYGGTGIDAVEAGISLATAMTISGAAASPNMGYHSTPATSFLMTLFNLRLGVWLANPAVQLPHLWRRSSPRSAVRPLILELLGKTNERGNYVNLSDGGHFENLGIYEMVRRRCKFILVSDAASDPDCLFSDLGNAVRKVSIDFNIDITFKTMRIANRTNATEKTLAFALGTIRYSETETGHILYVKPTYLKQLPMDVKAYGSANSTFPHESTADQWFSESQFESYRRLGYYLMSSIAGENVKKKPRTLEELFETASEMLEDDEIDEKASPSNGEGPRRSPFGITPNRLGRAGIRRLRSIT